ncbi:MAG: carboxypeptidase regulatory-like domain-containing protein [Luteitalea sp.]|nr:carboxypeptidase regulatory-like domain-containing protein [Luteitalea sp.]
MHRSDKHRITLQAACVGALLLSVFVVPHAQPRAGDSVAIDSDDIGGVVSGEGGPEAGVWVIAETRDLGVRYIKSVVTDDRGRYVVPDLPKASYSVWARGYGLVDSAKATSVPGRLLNITATKAPDEAAAARYYPAIYWYSMLQIPGADQLGGKSGIPANVTRADWLDTMKSNGCIGCHQLGQLSTRTIPSFFGEFPSSEAAWRRRVQSGQSGQQMTGQLANQLGGVPFKYFGEWTDRIAKGELPHAKPPRPQGVERNIVVTLRDWMDEKHYLHDLISSDRRNPTVNANGPLYGSPEYSSDLIPILDPVKNTATTYRAPVRDPDMPLSLGPGHAAALTPMQPSAYWGDEAIWDTRVNNHNSMFDSTGRLWLTAAVRGPDNPAFCKEGSDHPSARLFPLERSNRHLAMLDPRTRKYTFVDTCYGTHHPQFGYDANDTLWTSGGGPVVGWLNTKAFDATGDAAKSQGWTALILDTNGNGVRDGYVEPNQPVDPMKDKRVTAGFYAVMPSPVDGSVWGSYRSNPGAVVRLNPGSNPPQTALAEVFNVPAPGFGVRGADIDSKGVVWVSLSSGHLGSFDRRKCKGPLNGPQATGDHCPEGWTFHQYPGPGFKGIGENSAESSYYTWVDQHNTFGLGQDVPMSTGNLNDGLIAFKNGRMIVLRVPYPIGFYAKGFDGRIDNRTAGWKGRGLWAANGDRTPWLIEGGKGSRPLAAHFQLRPDPLAK